MTVAWLLLTLTLAAVTLVVIRRFFGTGRIRRRIAFPLAVAERALADALGELTWERSPDVFVSPFEPVVERLASLSDAELYSLGKEAAEGRRRLLDAVRAWNAAAGNVKDPAALLPLLLTANEAARQLAAHIEGGRLEQARGLAGERVLVALVGKSAAWERWVQ